MNRQDHGCGEAAMALAIFILGLIGGAVIGGKLVAARFKDAARQHGAAEYNQTTGAWQWKENK